jgi:hypothetical protein
LRDKLGARRKGTLPLRRQVYRFDAGLLNHIVPDLGHVFVGIGNHLRRAKLLPLSAEIQRLALLAVRCVDEGFSGFDILKKSIAIFAGVQK